MKISQSKVKVWRRCRAAYSFKYVDKLVKKVKSRPLQFGSIVHHMIEAYANGGDPFEVLNKIDLNNLKLFEAEKELYGDIIEDIRYIMTDYFQYWKGLDDFIYIRHQKRNAEHKFEVEIGYDLTFTGKIDAFVKRRRSKKLKFIAEHKTFKRKPDEDARWRNVQSAVYVKACQILGWGHFDGVAWDYIGNKPPREPEILKSGLLSRRAIVTVPSVVLAFLKRENLSTTHYKEFIESVRANLSDYFIRYYTPTNPEVVSAIFKDFVTTAHDIQEHHGRDRTRTIDLHCSYCDFEPICRAELLGLDVDFVKERQYDVKEEGDEPLIEDDATD